MSGVPEMRPAQDGDEFFDLPEPSEEDLKHDPARKELQEAMRYHEAILDELCAEMRISPNEVAATKHGWRAAIMLVRNVNDAQAVRATMFYETATWREKGIAGSSEGGE